GDVALVKFEIVDSTGTVVPTADNIVRITVSGGRILALDNANLRDLEPYHTDHRHVFNGRGLAILRADRPGLLRVTARADGLTETSRTIAIRNGVAAATISAAR